MSQEAATVVNETAEQAPATPESATEEKELEVVTEGEPVDPRPLQNSDDAVEETEETEETEESTETEETDAAKDDDEGESKLSQKSQNRFQQLSNENRALREQLNQLQARKAQVAQEQELLDQINPETGEPYTLDEVQRIARYNANQAEQERISQQEQVLAVQANQQQLASEAQQALQDFAMFDESKADTYNKDLAQMADGLLGDALYMDEQGGVLGSKVSPHKIYQTVASAYEQGVRAGRLEGQKSTQKMLAQSDIPSGAPVQPSASDEKKMSADEYAAAKGLKPVW